MKVIWREVSSNELSSCFSTLYKALPNGKRTLHQPLFLINSDLVYIPLPEDRQQMWTDNIQFSVTLPDAISCHKLKNMTKFNLKL